jgi:hypothetical protein
LGHWHQEQQLLDVMLKSDWTLIDAGANICLTSDISLLADAVFIPPVPITDALHGNSSSSFDNCCMQMVAK